jgi:molybdopterin-guanine dinucleotide biosynthesis protein A
MGRDKALLPFGDSPTLTQYQIKRVAPWFESVHVSCKDKKKFDFSASFIEDSKEFEEFSPLIALYSVLKNFNDAVCILSVDTPFVPKEVFESLHVSFGNKDAIIAKSPFGTHQLCGIYSIKTIEILKQQIEKGNHKIRNYLNLINTEYKFFDGDNLFFNMNKKEDYNLAKSQF